MQRLVILFFLAQTVFGRVAYNLGSHSSNGELSPEAIEEIQKLIDITKSVEELQEPLPKEVLLRSLRVTEEDLRFFVHNRNDRVGKKVSIAEIEKISQLTAFDKSLDTVVTIHGWNNKYNSTFNNVVGGAVLDVKDVNVISVDWDTFALKDYLSAFHAVEPVGKLVGEFILNLSETYTYSLDRVSLIGHSLGAHVSGFAGKATGSRVASITGLDPAGPLYANFLPNSRLNNNDAKYVEAIHTDGSLLGLSYHIGDVDFWPNGGLSQPGCPPSFGSCSHARSYLYFAESLSSNNFYAKKCTSFAVYKAGRCEDGEVALMGGPTNDQTKTGNFYLTTNLESPFARGKVDL